MLFVIVVVSHSLRLTNVAKQEEGKPSVVNQTPSRATAGEKKKRVRRISNTLLAYSAYYKCSANERRRGHQSVMLSAGFRPGQSHSLLLLKMLKHLEAKSASGGGATAVGDYVCGRSVGLISVYHPESQPGASVSTPGQILLLCRLAQKQVQINVSVLKFGLECFVQWDASADLSDGRELQPLSPRSKVLLMMKERKRARETNFSEARRRPHREGRPKFFQPKERHRPSQRIKQQSVL